MGARGVVFKPPSSPGARGAGRRAGAIGTNRGSRQGGYRPALQLPRPDRGAALAKFPLENPIRYRPLSRRAFEGRRALDPAHFGRNPEALGLARFAVLLVSSFETRASAWVSA